MIKKDWPKPGTIWHGGAGSDFGIDGDYVVLRVEKARTGVRVLIAGYWWGSGDLKDWKERARTWPPVLHVELTVFRLWFRKTRRAI